MRLSEHQDELHIHPDFSVVLDMDWPHSCCHDGSVQGCLQISLKWRYSIKGPHVPTSRLGAWPEKKARSHLCLTIATIFHRQKNSFFPFFIFNLPEKNGVISLFSIIMETIVSLSPREHPLLVVKRAWNYSSDCQFQSLNLSLANCVELRLLSWPWTEMTVVYAISLEWFEELCPVYFIQAWI